MLAGRQTRLSHALRLEKEKQTFPQGQRYVAWHTAGRAPAEEILLPSVTAGEQWGVWRLPGQKFKMKEIKKKKGHFPFGAWDHVKDWQDTPAGIWGHTDTIQGSSSAREQGRAGTLQMALGTPSPTEVISDGCSGHQLLAEQSRGVQSVALLKTCLSTQGSLGRRQTILLPLPRACRACRF